MQKPHFRITEIKDCDGRMVPVLIFPDYLPGIDREVVREFMGKYRDYLVAQVSN